MDAEVVLAMQRWPNVPDMYGWLSLDRRGRWLIHPDAQTQGLPISNQQIIQFIGRNYQCDVHGRYFFQNGPQRVFVELAAAPWIMSIKDDQSGFVLHNQQLISDIQSWLIDDDYQVYAHTDIGPALLHDHDLQGFIDRLPSDTGLERLLNQSLTTIELPAFSIEARPVRYVPTEVVPTEMGFVKKPKKIP